MAISAEAVSNNQVPAGLADVALIDAKACAAAGGMSLTNWYKLVREGLAPKPAVSFNRFARWKLADVRQFLIDLAASPSDGAEVAGRAARAAQAAKAKRLQAQHITAA